MDTGRHFFFDAACHGNMFALSSGDSLFRGSRSLVSMEENSTKKRPFFSYADDYIEEEFYDEQLPEKKRRLTAEQVHLLEKSFTVENKLEPERKTDLAKKLGLQPRQVAIWFQNRRARWKNKQLERDYDDLKASYDSLLSNYDAMVKENEKVKSEVVSLTEKLQAKDVAGTEVDLGQQPDSLLTNNDTAAAVNNSVKTEDNLSSGSRGSAVLDGDSSHLLESDGSYFPDDEYRVCMGQVDNIYSEEDDGSDDGRSYFPDVFDAVQQQDVTEPSAGWWVWS